MRSIEVECNVPLLQFGDGVANAVVVCRRGLLAFLNAHVSDQVTEGIGLDDDGVIEVAELGFVDEGNDLVDELAVLGGTIVVEGKLAGGGLSGAVALGEVVDDEGDRDLLLRVLVFGDGFFQVAAEVRDLIGGVSGCDEGEIVTSMGGTSEKAPTQMYEGTVSWMVVTRPALSSSPAAKKVALVTSSFFA